MYEACHIWAIDAALKIVYLEAIDITRDEQQALYIAAHSGIEVGFEEG
jgi:hypothetical protein